MDTALGGLTLMQAFDLAKTTAMPSGRWNGLTWKAYFYAIRGWEAHGISLLSQLTRETIGRFRRDRLTVDEVAAQSVNMNLVALLSILDELSRTERTARRSSPSSAPPG
jgi:hypothetical protein